MNQVACASAGPKGAAIDLCIVLSVAAGVALDHVAKSYTWSYPSFQPTSADPITLLPWSLRLAAALGITLVVIAATLRRNAGNDARIPILIMGTGLAVAATWHLWQGFGESAVIRSLQDAVTATYLPLCACMARFAQRRLAAPFASIAYALAHVVFLCLCSWNVTYGRFYPSTPTVVWMAASFAVAFVHVRGWTTMHERRRLFGVLVVAQTAVVCFPRLVIIMASFKRGSDPQTSWFFVNWWACRVSILLSQMDGGFTTRLSDPALLSSVVNFPLVWLGITRGLKEQLLYAITLACFLACVWQRYRTAPNTNQGHLIRLLATSILLSNVWGLVCTANLFWSTRVFPLTSCNVFQVVPILLLVYASRGYIQCREKETVRIVCEPSSSAIGSFRRRAVSSKTLSPSKPDE